MDHHTPPAVPKHAVPLTILGQQQPRIPTAGKIRAGIKVLTKTAASNPSIKALYDDGLVNNATFEEIEQKIVAAFPDMKSPLVPKNVAWFTVRPNDFPNPAIAEQILNAYGEDRGDGVVRLYRFPVMFPADRWQAVMPHQLACWARNEKRYWSEYGPDIYVTAAAGRAHTIAGTINFTCLPLPIVARFRHQKKKKPLKIRGLVLV